MKRILVLLLTLAVFASGTTACSPNPVDETTIQALGYGDWDLRWTVAREVARTGPEVISPLVQALEEEEDPRVRVGAVWALGLIGPEEQVLTALIRALEEDGNWQVRWAAAGALNRAGRRRRPGPRPSP
jgi:HEAT repeat protein